jgi:ankyrin repeat protein
LAAKRGSVAIVQHLLAAGADPHSSSKVGPWHFDVVTSRIVTFFLLPQSGQTVLMSGASSDSLETLEVLLAAGVDVNAAKEVSGTQSLLFWQWL